MKYTVFQNKSIVYDAQTPLYPIDNSVILNFVFFNYSIKKLNEG